MRLYFNAGSGFLDVTGINVGSARRLLVGFSFHSYLLIFNYKFTHFTISNVDFVKCWSCVTGNAYILKQISTETRKQYIIGFVVTVAAAVMYAFLLALVELAYQKASNP
ncbi:hypothetical protein Bca4012_054879 [Brassica carinata]|uniref:Uncharacterized protein n=1 Tax=Brassica carinata TaxID=52824 RepID=A0A8X8B172_BRACI|nr:hypothetical protein Bca52824_012123 [Brassica carinata]